MDNNIINNKPFNYEICLINNEFLNYINNK